MKDRMRKVPCWVIAFGLNLIIAMLAFLPFIIRDNGYFAMSYDYAARGMAYNRFMNDTVKSGEVLWNWNMELGGNFLESFSSQCLGSVFFLLGLAFPSELLPKVMVWIHMLKYAVAGAASAGYVNRHVKKREVVILASMLYAFSGFQYSTVIHYYYQDAAALFPLMLIGLEQFMEEKKKGSLIAASFLNAFCNFKFFIGELVFVALYYVMKYLIPDRKAKKSWKQCAVPALSCMAEEMLGMALGGVLLVPTLCGLLSRERVINHLFAGGWLTIASGDIMQVLKAVLFPAENMNNMSNLIRMDWRGNSLYLPIVGVIFVLAYVMQKKDWLSNLLKILALCTLVPILNGFFTLVMEEMPRYWFYMPILMMVLATAKVIESPKEYTFKKPIILWLACMVFYFVMVFLVKWDAAGSPVVYSKTRFMFYALIGVAGVIFSVLLVKFCEKKGVLLLNGAVALFSVGILVLMVYFYQRDVDNTGIDFHKFTNGYAEGIADYYNETYAGLDVEVLPYRYHIDEGIGYCYYNLAMANSLPSVNAFMEETHPSILEFYECMGLRRDGGSVGVTDALKCLLGVKHIVSPADGLAYGQVGTLSNSNGQTMYVYDNEAALPMGFTYDSYITRSEFKKLDENLRPVVMLSALVVEDEDAKTAKRCLEHLKLKACKELSVDDWEFAAEERRMESSNEFEAEKNGFRSVIVADNEKYAFYSVPYDAYWNASVNGEEAEILNVNGFMAVKVNAGENEVVFTYEYTPVKVGIGCSIFGLALTIIYLTVLGKRSKERNR